MFKKRINQYAGYLKRYNSRYLVNPLFPLKTRGRRTIIEKPAK